MIYRFIDNIGDYFTPGYYTDDFKDKVINMYVDSIDTLEETEEGDKDSKSAIIRSINSKFSGLKAKYYSFKNLVKENKLHKRHIIKETHEFNSELMSVLGYDTTPAYSSWIHIDSHSVVPARSVLLNGDKTRLVIMEMQPMIKYNEDDQPAGLFEQQYNDDESVTKEQKYFYPHWSEVIQKPLPEGCKISPSKINEAVSAIFNLPEQRPQYILILAGNVIMLIEQDKWDHGAYLKFDLEELFSEASIDKFRDYYTLFYLLTSKEVLAGDAHLMEQISEESFKNAYEVTKDLKNGVIRAVELLANEALHYKKNIQGLEFDETDDTFEARVKDDCLTIIYRLLFIFYAEARPEIGILPMNDEIYAKGYSLDILRDLEQTPLKSDQERNSYFFNDSLWTLFRLISGGHHETEQQYVSFKVRKIDSPLFDDEKLKELKGVRYRNFVWQDIICSLSLSEEQSRKQRGRISYANLGVNQLGSVYESLLAYRGFYAEEDYIEVHKAGDPKDGTFLVPRSRMHIFKDNEILHKPNGDIAILEKGSFVYRLNGRDRKKSASYYTPEILTKSTVKYTLKGFVDKLDAGEMEARELLKLKILEPAMGAAAFQNEVINQVAELYLKYRQKETGKRIAPHKYRDELQKVKAYIATKNIYGVDLNPTAIELGKLSLWLNVIHKDMETPFFGHRIALGNAVIGAWFKAYDESELCKVENKKSVGKTVSTEWWTKAPHLLHFSKERKKIIRKVNEIYPFLVPDKNMLGVLKIAEQKAANPEKSTVTQAVEKITGLKRDDFKKIVMLAQGEFQEFLEAKGADRNKILGRIYNNSPHIDLECRLNGVRNCLSERKKTLDKNMQEALSSCKIPEGLDEDDKARLDLYVEDKNDLFEALSKVEELLIKENDKINETIRKQEEKKTELIDKKAKAEQNNALLDQRNKLEAELEVLLESATKYEALEQKKNDVKKAGSLLPYKETFDNVSLKLKEAKSKKEELEKKKDNCEEQVSLLGKKARELENENLSTIDEKNKEVIRLRELSPVYDDLDKHTKSYNDCKGIVSKLSEELDKVVKQLTEVEEKKNENEAILSAYEDAGESAVANAASVLKGVNEQSQRIKTFAQALEETKLSKANMISCNKKFLAAEEQTKKAQEDYNKASRLLREGRAGSLAKEMIDALNSSNEVSVSCPVCGVVHTKEDIGGFTKVCEKVPDEKEVDSLYNELERARNEEQKLHGNYSLLKGKVDLAIKSINDDAKKIFHKDLTYEELLSSDVVAKEDERLSLEQEKANKAYEDAIKAKEIKNKALLKKEQLKVEHEDFAKKKEDLTTKMQAEDRKLVTISRDVENAKKQLKDAPATKDLAEKTMEKAQKDIQSLKDSYEKARKAYQDMEKSLGEVIGQLQENSKQIDALQEEENKAKKNLEGKLKDLGYENISQGMEVLRVDGRVLSSLDEVSKWCDKTEKEVTEYRSKASDVESRLNENQKNTKDLSYVDIKGLSDEIAKLLKEKEALEAKTKEDYSSLMKTRENIACIHKGMDKLQQLHKVELELKPMVDNTAGRTYKLRDYVLGDFFKQIVKYASHYFSKLMDGKFSLEAVDSDKKSTENDSEDACKLEPCFQYIILPARFPFKASLRLSSRSSKSHTRECGLLTVSSWDRGTK